MLNAILRFALSRRGLVLGASALLLVLGALQTARMPLDVLPDISAPSVTVVTEASGLAPEEVEQLVTFPLESGLNGMPGLRRLRSVSAAGISVIWVELEWGEDLHRARQVVTERLSGARLPAAALPPQLGPMSSVMGEITFLALTSETVSTLELRRLAETVVRRALLGVPGISQVVPIGGDVRSIRVEADPLALATRRVDVTTLVEAVEGASRTSAAGFHVERGEERLVRALGRAEGPADLAAGLIRVEGGLPLTVGDVATVEVAAEPRRGTAAFSTKPAVVLSVQKQPGANTLELTRELDRQIAALAASLPPGVRIETESFRQADFIQVAIANVTTALRDGAFLVVVVLLLFLGNVRATLISALAIPLSLVAGALILAAFGESLNTMTLGGLAIAIGALVDDAIIDVENVFRRLRQERLRPEGQRRPALEVVFRASSEVRGAIFFATLIIVLVFLPLFVLPGMEGRLLRPLGLAYVAALLASLLVSLTVTPALCSFLLPRAAALDRPEPWLLRQLRGLYRPSLAWALAHPRSVIATTALATLAALGCLTFLGRSFLPPFEEGALTVGVVSPPGTPLEEGDHLGRQVESALLAFPEVVSTTRRTGRAERDEHVQGVNASELEVVLRPGRPKPELLQAMRQAVATIPGVQVSFGQPISHRIDHMISGSKTNLAVKIFGPDLAVLRGLAGRAQGLLATVPGLVDVSNQEQASVPQLVLDFDRAALARHGLSAATLSRTIEALFQGTEAGEVVSEGLISRVVVTLPEALRADPAGLGGLPVPTPAGPIVRLDEVARPRFDLGPGLVRRENVARVAMITANVAGADLTGTVERAQEALTAGLELPTGYRLTFGGQFEEATRASRNLAVLALLVLIAMYGLLFVAFRSQRAAWIVMANLPLALLGGIFAVALGGGVLSVASLVGFITLFGIATRNGVLLVSHYQHLQAEEGLSLEEAVFQGSLERLAPVLMTALTAGLALIPLVLAGGRPGNEIQSPMAEVILGGLLSSTLLNLVLVPVLFARWGRGPSAVASP
jgi:CzcA family heavy metal efflux pump